jgi:hypothetical protein
MGWAACNSCLSWAERLEGSCLRKFALELREQLAQTLAVFVTSILAMPRSRLDAEEAAQPPLPQIVEMLQQVMCKRGAASLRYLCSKSMMTVIAKREVQSNEIPCSSH